MLDLLGNHIVGFPTRRLIYLENIIALTSVLLPFAGPQEYSYSAGIGNSDFYCPVCWWLVDCHILVS